MSNLNPQQFGDYEFRIAKGERRRGHDNDFNQVLVRHGEEVVGSLSYNLPNRFQAGEGKEIGSVWVHPEHRGPVRRVEGKAKGRGGLGAAMYHVASRDVGYKISHSAVLSPRGLKFAQTVGGPMKAKEAITRNWEVPDPGSVTRVNEERWAGGEKIDPLISNALTPVQKKPNRRRKPKQQTIPGLEDY